MVAGTLPQAQVKYGEFPSSDFVTMRDVPVFAEHETTTKDGRKLKFGMAELQAVADRCNRRIQQTGDYAAITLGHTPDPSSPNQEQPEVVGLAGPFKVGLVGAPGQRMRYAVLADMHFYKDDYPKVRKHPRRSPELFVEDTYDEMFLDPIALLGAEAPRLDMGLLYAAERNGHTIHKYTAVAPAASNVFVRSEEYSAEQPSADISPEKARKILRDGQVHGKPLTEAQKGMFGAAAGRKDYSADDQADTPSLKEPDSVLGPEDLQQIVEAIMATDVMKWASSEMQKAAQANATVPPGDTLPAPPSAPPAGLPPEAPAATPAQDAGPPPAGPPSPPTPSGPPSSPPSSDEDKEKMGCDKRYEASESPTGEYQTADQGELGGRKVEHTLGNPVDENNASAKQYQAEGSNDADNSKPTSPSVEGSNTVAEGSTGEPGETAASTYQTANQGNLGGRTVEHTEGNPVKEGNAAGAKYRILETKVNTLENELGVMKERYRKSEEARVDSERLGELQGLRYRHAFDLEKEFERCRFSRMSAEQFAEHTASIEANYRPIPIGEPLPVGFGDQAASMAPTKPGSGTTKEKYSADVRRKAFDWASMRAQKGLSAPYEIALDTFAEQGRAPTESECG